MKPPTRFSKGLGKAIRDTRQRRGLSVKALGAMSATDLTNLYRMETGVLIPPIPRLRLIAQALGLPASKLLQKAELLEKLG